MTEASPTPVTLQMAPRGRRPKPPRHLADMTPEERVEAVAELGHSPLRAKQLATHYFLTTDPERMTDLPAAGRDELVAGMLPSLLSPVRSLTADKGATVKTLWRLFDGVSVESVLMRYPNRATERLRVRPSWPVAQKGQAMPQPTWLEMHRVARFG
jgi:23S rRNA (adenine2503-C2)-methyltransferase